MWPSLWGTCHCLIRILTRVWGYLKPRFPVSFDGAVACLCHGGVRGRYRPGNCCVSAFRWVYLVFKGMLGSLRGTVSTERVQVRPPLHTHITAIAKGNLPFPPSKLARWSWFTNTVITVRFHPPPFPPKPWPLPPLCGLIRRRLSWRPIIRRID